MQWLVDRQLKSTDQTIEPQRKALHYVCTNSYAFSIPFIRFSFQEHIIAMVGCGGGIMVAVVVVIAGGRRRAAEHAPVAWEVDEGQRERAHEAGGAGQGDGLLDGVPRPAEEEPVRHDRAHRAAARRHPGHHAQRPAPTPSNPRRKNFIYYQPSHACFHFNFWQ